MILSLYGSYFFRKYMKFVEMVIDKLSVSFYLLL